MSISLNIAPRLLLEQCVLVGAVQGIVVFMRHDMASLPAAKRLAGKLAKTMPAEARAKTVWFCWEATEPSQDRPAVLEVPGHALSGSWKALRVRWTADLPQAALLDPAGSLWSDLEDRRRVYRARLHAAQNMDIVDKCVLAMADPDEHVTSQYDYMLVRQLAASGGVPVEDVEERLEAARSPRIGRYDGWLVRSAS
jgi:hypothetical protein